MTVRTCSVNAILPTRVGVQTDTSSSRTETKKTQTLAVMQKARGLYQTKVVANLVEITGASESTVKRRLRGQREMDLEHLVPLLHGEHGHEYLSAIMRRSESKWWSWTKLILKKIDVERIQTELESAAYQLTIGVQHEKEKRRAESRTITPALEVFDPEFFGPQRQAMESFSRQETSTVAQKVGRRK